LGDPTQYPGVLPSTLTNVQWRSRPDGPNPNSAINFVEEDFTSRDVNPNQSRAIGAWPFPGQYGIDSWRRYIPFMACKIRTASGTKWKTITEAGCVHGNNLAYTPGTGSFAGDIITPFRAVMASGTTDAQYRTINSLIARAEYSYFNNHSDIRKVTGIKSNSSGDHIYTFTQEVYKGNVSPGIVGDHDEYPVGMIMKHPMNPYDYNDDTRQNYI
jgi:hypothetical protein